jgi:hypothetical protein
MPARPRTAGVPAGSFPPNEAPTFPTQIPIEAQFVCTRCPTQIQQATQTGIKSAAPHEILFPIMQQ